MITLLKEILTKNELTISVAESCTSGNLQALLTSISGSSEYFEGGITVYNIDQKVKHLGVDRKVAEPVDCVSQEVADQMALGCSKLFETRIAISIDIFSIQYLLIIKLYIVIRWICLFIIIID
jgi:PncC family amidohydrolase